MTEQTEQDVREVDARLVEAYGDREHTGRGDPLSVLIRTILSQNTSGANSEAAYEALTRPFTPWDELVQANEARIANTIRSAGLANQKASRIRAIVREIVDERGEASLDWLDELDTAEAMEYLEHFKGVGPKTSACVMLFALGRPVFPVDTHVHRITIRLGWIPPDTNADEAHRILGDMVPAEIAYRLHVNLIQHGRDICHAQNPECAECPLLDMCEYARVHGPG